MQFSKALVLGALATLVSATCDPLTADNCPADPALGNSFSDDFKTQSKYWEVVNAGGVNFGDDGLTMTIAKRFDNPSIKSTFYIMFGKVEFVMEAAAGTGIISDVFLQSDDLDEIDWEWFGGDDYQSQSNYFSKGNTATYDRGGYHPTSPSPVGNFHTYGIEWTEDEITWSIDGAVVRSFPSNGPEAAREGYPQSPMFIMAGSWAGGDPSNAPGTIAWAGGDTDYSQAPFTLTIKSMIVTDYSSGTEYSYGDKSGSYQSIQAAGGEVFGRYAQGQQEFTQLQSGESVDSSFEAPSSDSADSSSTTVESASSTSSSSSSSASPSTSSSSSSSASSSTTSASSSSSSAPASSSTIESSSSAEASSTSASSSSSAKSSSSSSSSSSSASSSSEVSSTESEAASSSAPVTTSSASTTATTSSAVTTTATTSHSSSSAASSTASSSSIEVANGAEMTRASSLFLLPISIMVGLLL